MSRAMEGAIGTCFPPRSYETMKREEYFRYNTNEHPFRPIVKRMLKVPEEGILENIHTTVEGCCEKDYVTFETDQATAFHKTFYASDEFEQFLEAYRRFVVTVVAPSFEGEEKVVYQKRPTFRVHLPNNLAVGQKHRDGDYDHPDGEINFWMPFTEVTANSGIVLESEPDKGDFHPTNSMTNGDVFRFWGNKCWHYNNINDTGKTRVSIDFRVIPFSMWKPNEAGSSVKSGMRFVLGGYYDVCRTDGGGANGGGEGVKSERANE
eukprot:TRINITY_DN9745_c0_g1_i1.p1 TRINITY_DN9745_c0_g1~~TRINITY_DN9745_c0_g1_i1.p1  ORF type:complete len:264 (-),score=59.13 TRINITY_DN9745_c0_g1_i1:4-795(-)